MPLSGQVTIHSREKHSESADYPSFSVAFIGFFLSSSTIISLGRAAT
jgi:hypothetical protein